MRVPVAEDDEVLAETVAVGLQREGMAVDVVLDGNYALAQLPIKRAGRRLDLTRKERAVLA